MQIDVGAVVANKYELVRLLGRGSMGEVWVAHHRTLGEKLALKLLTHGPSGSDEIEDARQAAARFRFEAQVAARLSRKTRHIVRVSDHGEEDGLAYLVMELLDGQTLETALSRTPTLPLGSVVKLIGQTARALMQAHAEGVLHRDLKPANVFLSTDEDGALLVKLLDFGIARAIHAHRVPKSFVTHKGVVFGTPAYMSPEQARASSKLDHRCDLWALATIAYETLTGDLPVAGADAEELLKNLCAGRIVPLRVRNPRLPQSLGTFFDRAFAERIEARYASASDLAQDFESAAGASPSGTAAMKPPPGLAGAEPSPLSAWTPLGAPRRGPARWPPPRAATVAAVVTGLVVTGLAIAGVAARGRPASPGAVVVAPAATPAPSAARVEVAEPATAKPAQPVVVPPSSPRADEPVQSAHLVVPSPPSEHPPSFAHKSSPRPGLSFATAPTVVAPSQAPAAPPAVTPAPPPSKPIDKSDVL